LATRKPKEWTPARWHAFVVSVLRSGTRKYPPKYETLNEAKTTKQINKRTLRLAQHYLCRKCQKEYPASEVQVDHVAPVVGPEGFVSWDSFIKNLYCDKENLQVLCTSCHDAKTKKERETRKKRK